MRAHVKYTVGYSHPCLVDLVNLVDQASPCHPSCLAYPSFQVLLSHQRGPVVTEWTHAGYTAKPRNQTTYTLAWKAL